MRNIQYQGVQYRNDRLITPYYDFSGGIFYTENQDRLANNEVSNMCNLDIMNDGSLKMRDAFVVSELTGTILNDKRYEYAYVYDKGDSYEVLGLLDGDLVKIPSNEVLAEGYSNVVSMVQYKTNLYILGAGHFRVYDGTELKDVTVPEGALTEDEAAANDLDYVKDGVIMTVYNGRIVISGIPSEPNAVYYSQRNTPYFFDSTDASDILEPVQEDNDRIMALEPYASGLLIFKRNSVYIAMNVGSTSETLIRLNIPTGTISPKTIVRFDNFLAFWGTDNKVYGIYGGSYYAMTRDRVQTYCLSDNIDGMLQEYDNDWKGRAVATYYEGKYILAVHKEINNVVYTKTFNMYTLGRDTNTLIQQQSWSTYDHIDITGFIQIPDEPLQMFGVYTTRIFKFKKGDDLDFDMYDELSTTDDIAYTVYIKFKEYNMETPEHYKIFRAGWIQFSEVLRTEFQEFKHNLYIDKVWTYLSYNEDRQVEAFKAPEKEWSLTTTGTNWDDFYWSSNKNPAYYFRINSKGRTVQNELEFRTYGKKIYILGNSFEYKNKYPQRENSNTNFKRGNS